MPSTDTEDYPDLGYGDEPPEFDANVLTIASLTQSNPKGVTKLVTSLPNPDTIVGRTSQFEANPAIIHFGGFTVGVPMVQWLSFVNISSKIEKFQIIPPLSQEFKIEYEKITLPPGLCQKVKVVFIPNDYVYYHDYIRIRGEQQTLLVPMHAYPVINNLSIPRELSFGSVPLCERAIKHIRLACSIPVDFSFRVEVLNPHPYFTVTPTVGVIPSGRHVDINICFMPVTLGTCLVNLRIHVDQYGFKPVDCVVSGKAVSGLVESRALLSSEARVVAHIASAEQHMRTRVLDPGSTFALSQSAPASPSAAFARPRTRDPTAVMLSHTFRSCDVARALDQAVSSGTGTASVALLRSKLPPSDGPHKGVRADGTFKALQAVTRQGPGSGAVFDAGSEWMTDQLQQQSRLRHKHAGTTAGAASGVTGVSSVVQWATGDKQTADGFKVPRCLEGVVAVNFVLTQEPGKLKPRDLKLAIDRNRAERDLRAQEQKKLRDEGGGAGVLDLRGLLAEERLNCQECDSFKRQLRELAFLADVEEVGRQDTEKSFRASEQCMGAPLLTSDEIATVQAQRAQSAVFNSRSSWRNVQGRQHSEHFSPLHAVTKAGCALTTAALLTQACAPGYDTNKNDIWSKRLNTLRRFIGLVSRWVTRRRVTVRMSKIAKYFSDQGVTTREHAQALIARENLENKQRAVQTPAQRSASSRGGGSGGGAAEEDDKARASAQALARPATVALMVCAAVNDTHTRRLAQEQLIAQHSLQPSGNMTRRLLFPKCLPEEGASREEVLGVAIDQATTFDDRSFYPLKTRPEYQRMGYAALPVPPVPLSFAPCSDKGLRTGGREEAAIRPPADGALTSLQLIAALPPEQQQPNLTAMCQQGSDATDCELSVGGPMWLTAESRWLTEDLDLFAARPDVRCYLPEPLRCEMDDHWQLRPNGESIAYDADDSLRTRWMTSGGFGSVNYHLLRQTETRCVDAPTAPLSFADCHMNDTDRHRSGLYSQSQDHHRGLQQHDPDVAELQHKQAHVDLLTDSESDDDEQYVTVKPTLGLVRQLLKTPAAAVVEEAALAPSDKLSAAALKTAASAKNVKALLPPAAVTTQSSLGAFTDDQQPQSDSDEFSVLAEQDRRLDQVALLRDTRLLDHHSSFVKHTQTHLNAVSARLTQLSGLSSCLLYALPVQLPFHSYENDILQRCEAVVVPPLPPPYVQSAALLSLTAASATLDSPGAGHFSPGPGQRRNQDNMLVTNNNTEHF